MDFALVLLGYRAEHLLPELHSYPGSSVLCLSPDEEERKINREQMLRHWHMVLQFEKLAPSHAGLWSIWNTVVWKGWAVVRLLLMMNEMEEAAPVGAGTTYLLQGLHTKIPDEKAAETYTKFYATNRDDCGSHMWPR